MLLASSTSWRLPPRALAIACSSSAARLCTMPIQLLDTCTTARWASSCTSWPCCERSMRVDGNSRLPRICFHSSGRFVEAAADGVVVTGGSSGVGAGVPAEAGVTVGSAPAGGAGLTVGVGFVGCAGLVSAERPVVAGEAAATGVATDAATGADAGSCGSASRPSSRTSSQSRG